MISRFNTRALLPSTCTCTLYNGTVSFRPDHLFSTPHPTTRVFGRHLTGHPSFWSSQGLCQLWQLSIYSTTKNFTSLVFKNACLFYFTFWWVNTALRTWMHILVLINYLTHSKSFHVKTCLSLPWQIHVGLLVYVWIMQTMVVEGEEAGFILAWRLMHKQRSRWGIGKAKQRERWECLLWLCNNFHFHPRNCRKWIEFVNLFLKWASDDRALLVKAL